MVLVGDGVVGDDVDQLAGWDGMLDGVEEADEFLVAVLHVERCEQGSDAAALGVVGHGAALAWFEGQPRLCAVERLDLVLLGN